MFTPSDSACGPWPSTAALTLLTKEMLQSPSPLHPLFLLPALLFLPYAYQLLRLVLILSLSCLYLAVHTKPKPSWPGPIDGTFTSLLGLRMDPKKRRIFVCTSLIIFNWNRQHGPGRSMGEIYKTSVCIDCFLSAPRINPLLLSEAGAILCCFVCVLYTPQPSD